MAQPAALALLLPVLLLVGVDDIEPLPELLVNCTSRLCPAGIAVFLMGYAYAYARSRGNTAPLKKTTNSTTVLLKMMPLLLLLLVAPGLGTAAGSHSCPPSIYGKYHCWLLL
uniref:Uncharacterized protein n=1 Tax=Oryza glaberrima TaxID=4538 RepID=I1PYH3_ORYGL